MTNLYNLLKARAMKSRMETAASENASQTLNNLSSRTGPIMPSAQAGPAQPRMSMPNIQKARTPKTPSFAFSPEGVEQLHRYQRSGTGSSRMSRPQMGGNPMMPPPAGHAVFNIRTGKPYMHGKWCSVLIYPVQHKPVRRTSSTVLVCHTRIVLRRLCLDFPQRMRSLHDLENNRRSFLT